MITTVVRTGIMGFAVAMSLVSLSGPVAAKSADPAETCKNTLLTYQQRYRCKEELDNIQTKADQKKVVRKYSDMIRDAEKAKADK